MMGHGGVIGDRICGDGDMIGRWGGGDVDAGAALTGRFFIIVPTNCRHTKAR